MAPLRYFGSFSSCPYPLDSGWTRTFLLWQYPHCGTHAPAKEIHVKFSYWSKWNYYPYSVHAADWNVKTDWMTIKYKWFSMEWNSQKTSRTAEDVPLVLEWSGSILLPETSSGVSLTSSALLQQQQTLMILLTSARGPPRMLRGTGRVHPSPMYSMYSRLRENFHSQSASSCILHTRPSSFDNNYYSRKIWIS